MVRVLCTTVFALLLFLCTRGAGADPLPTTHWMTPSPPGETYYRIGATVGIIDAIEQSFWGLQTGGFGTLPGDDFLDLAPSLNIGGPTARFGYVFDEETEVPWGGRELRIELAGAYTSGDGRDSASRPAGVPFSVLSLDGTVIVPTVVLPARGVVETSHRAIEGAFHVASLYKLTDRLELAPTLSFVASRAKQSTDHDVILPFFGPFSLDFDQHSTLVRHRFGTELGAQFSYRLHDRLLLHAGAGIGFHYLHTRMKANDCAFGISGGGCTGGFYRTEVDKTDRRFGHRATLAAGWTWFLRQAEISVAATGASMRRSHMRGARVVSLAPLAALPAEIAYDNALNFGLTLEFRYRF